MGYLSQLYYHRHHTYHHLRPSRAINNYTLGRPHSVRAVERQSARPWPLFLLAADHSKHHSSAPQLVSASLALAIARLLKQKSRIIINIVLLLYVDAILPLLLHRGIAMQNSITPRVFWLGVSKIEPVTFELALTYMTDRADICRAVQLSSKRLKNHSNRDPSYKSLSRPLGRE